MSKAFPKSLLQFLVLEMQHGYVYEYHSRLATGDERLHYILQSITVYQKIDTLRYDGAFFWLTVPRNHPWSDQKWKEFQQDLRIRFQLPIQFGIMWNERRREEITGNMLLYKRADHPLWSYIRPILANNFWIEFCSITFTHSSVVDMLSQDNYNLRKYGYL